MVARQGTIHYHKQVIQSPCNSFAPLSTPCNQSSQLQAYDPSVLSCSGKQLKQPKKSVASVASCCNNSREPQNQGRTNASTLLFDHGLHHLTTICLGILNSNAFNAVHRDNSASLFKYFTHHTHQVLIFPKQTKPKVFPQLAS